MEGQLKQMHRVALLLSSHPFNKKHTFNARKRLLVSGRDSISVTGGLSLVILIGVSNTIGCQHGWLNEVTGWVFVELS